MRLPKIDPRKVPVKIGNPAKPGKRHAYTSLAKAHEYEALRAGYFFIGLFWFKRGDEQELKMRRLYNAMCRTLQPNEITPDGSPALPPSPEYFARMGYKQRPVMAR